LNNPARDRRKGMGLGLAIVKRLANTLGYCIEVSSNVAHGSVFGLQVERTVGAGAETYELSHSVMPRSALKGMLVLVVDDEIDILAAMEAILSSWGCLCILARSTEEAAKYVDSSLRFPDVIVTDHRLENHHNSFDVAASVTPMLPCEIPTIVISGESSRSLEREIVARGWTFMSKPVDAARLYTAISHALETGSKSGTAQ
jgi:response regulator RpfG family c-di-GMP phosphodiesterase